VRKSMGLKRAIFLANGSALLLESCILLVCTLRQGGNVSYRLTNCVANEDLFALRDV
jgi:hypothetical protein